MERSTNLSRLNVRMLQAKAKGEPLLARKLLARAVNQYLAGDPATGKKVLRKVIHMTVGFEPLSQELGKSSKSLHRMLGKRGNPKSTNFFEILSVLQKRMNVRLHADMI